MKYRHHLKSVFIISDSKIALSWKNSSRKLPLFVENQVDRIRKIERSIQDLDISVQFLYINSEQNPADLATRPISKEQFESSSWLSGPQWFSLPRPSWPIENFSDDSLLADDVNSKQTRSSDTCAMVTKAPLMKSGDVVDFNRFRHYSHALKTLTRAMKALSHWISLVKAHRNRSITTEIIQKFDPTKELTAEELIPLEIRSITNDESPTEIPKTENFKQIGQRRILPPRKAKENVKYNDDQESEGNPSSIQVYQRASSSSVLAKTLLYPFLLLALICVCKASQIECAVGKLRVIPPSDIYILCFNNACRNRTRNDTTTFALPPSTHQKYVNITVYSRSDRTVPQSKMCLRRSFCDDKTIFTLSLLGNPHCWPFGAILSAVCFVTVTILLAAFCGVVFKKIIPKNATIHLPTRRTQRPPAHVLVNLRPSTFVAVALFVLAICTPTTLSCQQLHMRHGTEIICNESNVCTFEYEQEFLFNKLHREACVFLEYRNQTVGKLTLNVERTRQICNKETLFFTRDTFSQVFYERRCPFMGSCFGDTCSTLQLNDSVPELQEAEKYPGYSKCSATCGGIACGCLGFPSPGCMFYRVAQVPYDPHTYHIFQ
ncbi:unnamed protein product, partial [Nippostrongylus brasiliensis]|uniref:Phlebovirus_G2 domain-containing protein n=1 Tax=Nippostrongylus brasiliensis TaxID=27835 RepID=A0A0N4XKW7_NIPBR